jgi:hypothetical protein
MMFLFKALRWKSVNFRLGILFLIYLTVLVEDLALYSIDFLRVFIIVS